MEFICYGREIINHIIGICIDRGKVYNNIHKEFRNLLAFDSKCTTRKKHAQREEMKGF